MGYIHWDCVYGQCGIFVLQDRLPQHSVACSDLDPAVEPGSALADLTAGVATAWRLRTQVVAREFSLVRRDEGGLVLKWEVTCD